MIPFGPCPRCGCLYRIKPICGDFVWACECPPPKTYTTDNTSALPLAEAVAFHMELGKTMTYQNQDAGTLHERADHLQNDARTCNQIVTRLTQEGSADVPDGLVQMRRRHGFDSPIGRRCSNILEMLDAGTARPADIAEQVAELAALTN